MITYIDEPIQVGAVFGRGKKIKPVWFIWNKRQYRIREITYSWASREGSARLYHFSVTDGRTLYEISYNTETLAWRLMGAEVE